MLLLMTLFFQEQAAALTPVHIGIEACINVNAATAVFVTRLRTTNDGGTSVRGIKYPSFR